MSTTTPDPEKLKPELIRRIELMADEDLLFVHEVLLHAEKDQLWREISAEAEGERDSGSWNRLPEIIQQVRMQRRQP